MKTIEILVSEDGEINVEANGFPDKTCLEALKELEKALGKAKNVELKPEGHRLPLKNRKVRS